MIYLTVALGLTLIALGGSLYVLWRIVTQTLIVINAQNARLAEELRTASERAVGERSMLEDRMMALSKPDQLTLFKANEGEGGVGVSYVDEEELDLEEELANADAT